LKRPVRLPASRKDPPFGNKGKAGGPPHGGVVQHVSLIGKKEETGGTKAFRASSAFKTV